MLLVDEVDKADVEVEGLLLEVLSDFQVTIPELGTVAAVRRPFVVLTSNATRELSEAVKRRCLYLHLDYPSADRERAIVTGQVPELDDRVAEQLVATIGRLRDLDLKKSPSIAETVDWARTLVALQIKDLDPAAIDDTLGVVLKHASDQARAVRELKLRADVELAAGSSTVTSTSWSHSALPACRCRSPRTRRLRGALGAAVGRPRDRSHGVRRHAGQAPGAPADLRHALRPLLPAPRRNACRGVPTTATSTASATTLPLAGLRDHLLAALAEGDVDAQRRLAVEAVGRFGAMPGRAPGLPAGRRTRPCGGSHRTTSSRGSWQRCGRRPRRGGGERVAARRLGGFTAMVEADARRRLAEEKGAEHVPSTG